MKLFPCVLASCLMVAVADAADETKDKIDKSKLVGVWELKKGIPGLVQLPGDDTSLEFTKDGKVKVITHNVFSELKAGNFSLIQKGTYKVDGNKLTIDIDDVSTTGGLTIEINPKERSIKTTITKLTDKDLHVKSEVDPTEEDKLGEFTKKK